MIQLYIKFILLFFLIDLIWLKGGSKYHLQNFKLTTKRDKLEVNYTAALLFYLIAPIAYIVFVKKVSKNKKEAFMYGALMGFLLYGTYDFTNKAVYNKDYSWRYAFMDVTWGTLLFGLVSYLLY